MLQSVPKAQSSTNWYWLVKITLNLLKSNWKNSSKMPSGLVCQNVFGTDWCWGPFKYHSCQVWLTFATVFSEKKIEIWNANRHNRR